MSCNISLGRLEGCKDIVGGLNAVYFINFGDATFTVDGSTDGISGVVETTPSAYKYDLRGNSNFEQSLTSSRENGTTFAEQTLTVSLKKQDASTHKEVKLLAYGRPHILVEDNNGSLWVMGQEYGTEMTATASTGAAMGDKNGYELSFVAMEKTFARAYEGTIADFSVTLGS